MNADTILIWCQNCELNKNMVYYYNMRTDNSSTHELHAGDIPVLPQSSRTPPLVLGPGKLKILAFSTDQAKLINQLMVYENASVADVLCR